MKCCKCGRKFGTVFNDSRWAIVRTEPTGKNNQYIVHVICNECDSDPLIKILKQLEKELDKH